MFKSTNNEVKKVGVGVVGLGWISSVHLPSLKRIPEAELIAVCDVIEEVARSKAIEYGAKKYYTDYEKLLEDDEIDMIDILLPTELHAKAIIKALEAGKHAIVEKPIARTLEEAEEIVKVSRKAKTKFTVAHNYRFWPKFAKVKEVIDSGSIGKVKAILTTHRGWFWWKGAWTRWTLKKESGGPIVEVGIHPIDLLRWYFGKEVTQVYSLARKIHFGIEVPDLIYITLNFENEGVGVIEVSRTIIPRNYPFYHQIHVEGSDGVIESYDSYDYEGLIYNELGIRAREGELIIPRHGFEQELKHFIRCILEDKEPLVSAEDAKKALEISLAAVHSAEIGKPVKLPLEER